MSTPPRRRIDEIGEESRNRILDAAEALFAERGFERTSFVDIAERSGISRGSIPWHFKNKAGLLTAVVERTLDRAMAPSQYETPPKLAEVFADYAEWARTSNSAVLFMLVTEALGSTGPVHDQYQAFLRRGREDLTLWLRAQRPEGVDPAVASKQERAFGLELAGTLLGIHLHALLDPEQIDLREALQAVADRVDGNLAAVWETEPPAVGSAKARNGAKRGGARRASRKPAA